MTCFWKHKWGPWKVTERGEIQRMFTDAVIGSYLVQERQCEECGKVESELNEQRL